MSFTGVHPGMNETHFQQAVINHAHVQGWIVAHFRKAKVRGRWQTPVQADGAGFPDLCLARNGRVVFAELKSRTGSLSPEQRKWLDALVGDAAEVYVWKPKDWDEIERVLGGDA